MSRFLQLLFPRRCPLCGKVIPFGAEGCDCCTLQTQRIAQPACEHCGAETADCSCGRSGELTLSHLAAPFYYTGKVRSDLLELKIHGERDFGRVYGREMALCFALCFPDLTPDCVTAVPMTKRAKRARGFNQSELLAKETARRLFLPYARMLQKTRETKAQHLLSEQARKTNLNSAFSLLPQAEIRGKTVLLVDDIKTTGATLRECESVLLANGAAAVYCLCCAITADFRLYQDSAGD